MQSRIFFSLCRPVTSKVELSIWIRELLWFSFSFRFSRFKGIDRRVKVVVDVRGGFPSPPCMPGSASTNERRDDYRMLSLVQVGVCDYISDEFHPLRVPNPDRAIPDMASSSSLSSSVSSPYRSTPPLLLLSRISGTRFTCLVLGVCPVQSRFGPPGYIWLVRCVKVMLLPLGRGWGAVPPVFGVAGGKEAVWDSWQWLRGARQAVEVQVGVRPVPVNVSILIRLIFWPPRPRRGTGYI